MDCRRRNWSATTMTVRNRRFGQRGTENLVRLAMYTPAYRCWHGERVKKFTTLLLLNILGLVLTGRAMAQTDTNPAPNPPDATQKPASSKDTVVPTRDTVIQQKATANPMKLSNPENVQVKPLKTPEQKESDKSRKKYDKSQKKAQKKAEKEQRKAASQASKAHLNGH